MGGGGDEAEDTENWGKAGKGRAGHSSGETEGWHVRVSCGVLEVGVSQAPGEDVRTACSPAPGGGRAARVEDGASGRAETRRVSGTL